MLHIWKNPSWVCSAAEHHDDPVAGALWSASKPVAHSSHAVRWRRQPRKAVVIAQVWWLSLGSKVPQIVPYEKPNVAYEKRDVRECEKTWNPKHGNLVNIKCLDSELIFWCMPHATSISEGTKQ